MHVRGITFEKTSHTFHIRHHIDTPYGHASQRYTACSIPEACAMYEACIQSIKRDHAKRTTD